MNIIVFAVLLDLAFVVFIVAKFSYQMHANRKRIERGEAPKKYHDATDYPPPVNVIDWTRQ